MNISLAGAAADRPWLVAGPIAVLGLMLWMAGWTGTNWHAGLDAVIVLTGAVALAALWLAAAAGLGWPLRAWMLPQCDRPIAIQLGLGIAAMLTLTNALGRLGLLQLGGSVGAWLLVILGVGLLIEQVRRHFAKQPMVLLAPCRLAWCAVPAIAVGLLACASAPGWLWATEFGGYDVLSYHLQLPKQWMSAGAIAPLEHNVYSFLPGYMESAYYHIMLLRGHAIAAVYACQLLHFALAIITAYLVTRLFDAGSRDGQLAGAVAAVVLLGTPWVIVTGSLAYNEMAVILMLATGLLVYREREAGACGRGMAMGVLAAAACGAKLTAIGFVAAPLGVALLMSTPRRAWLRAILAGAIAGVVVLLPSLLHNAAVAGNPVFPFATSVFGSGHWDQQQVNTWTEGHQMNAGLIERAGEGWRQLMRYGIASNPDPSEPWKAQWSILPWLILAGLIVLLMLGRGNSLAAENRRFIALLAIIMLIHIVFWLFLTHVKSRFILPLVVPGSVTIGLAVQAVQSRTAASQRPMLVLLAGGLLAWATVPMVIFSREGQGSPAARIGMARMLTGDGLTDVERKQLAEHNPVIYINHLLPPGSVILFVGEAAPLYYMANYTYQTTWDRGPLSNVMRTSDDPEQWFAELRDRGYTHLLVNTIMLDIWETSGWNDPLLTSERVTHAEEEFAELQRHWPSGHRLYRLR